MADARKLTRARILLLANKNKKNIEIDEILNVGRNTAGRIKKIYLEEGLQNAIEDNPRTGQPTKRNAHCRSHSSSMYQTS